MGAKVRRHDGRLPGHLRPVKITPDFVRSADGSCLMELGRTRVICTASITAGVPSWRANSALGWMTAEYGMLPASTGKRTPRSRLKPDGRMVEIQRIIGRVLRSVVRFDRLGNNTVYLDCDVLDADGGTRTAAITGAYVALSLLAGRAVEAGAFRRGAVSGAVAAVSVGIVDGRAMLDMDYSEDAAAEVDMNVAMTNGGKFIEIQGTSEGSAFDSQQLDQLLALAGRGIRKLLAVQRQAIRKGLKK